MQHSTEIIFTPKQTELWLSEALLSCKDEFITVSPFVTDVFFSNFLTKVPPSVNRQLYTRIEIKDFASGASSLSAVTNISDSGTVVSVIPKLHAKIYVVDSSLALVTSANATRGGLYNNLECGVALNNVDLVSELKESIRNGFGANNMPRKVSSEFLHGLKPSVEVYKKALSKALIVERSEIEFASITMEHQSRLALIESLGGWRSLTFKGVTSLNKDVFVLEEVYRACQPLARLQYPDNRNIKAKLRQQLQILRNLGLVEFLGGGSYCCLVKSKEIPQ